LTSPTFEFDGRPIPFRSGQTLASALWASGERVWRVTARGRLPRGYYCGAGFCYECLVVVDGRGNTRACQTPARSGLRVATQDGFGPP
jgi:predicted molibdopterin-dependent oxidoreductase YjgC